VLDQVNALRAVIGEYRDERSLAATRLEQYSNKRDQLELARELLVEHGQTAEADQLKVEIQDLDHHIRASQQLIAKLDGLVAMYQASLEHILQSQTR
jgi:chromosome segregation ATPase